MADEHKKTRKGKSVTRIIEWIVTKVKILNYKIKKKYTKNRYQDSFCQSEKS